MMNAGPKRASISAILTFADLRQVPNTIAEAHQYSILADDVQPDRRFLLSSHESTSYGRPIARSTLRALTWKKPRRTTADKSCVFAEATRELALFFSSKSDLPLTNFVRLRLRFGRSRSLLLSAAGGDEHE
jgi:hypothetical protein